MLLLQSLADHGTRQLVLQTAIPLPRAVDLPFDAYLPGAGWYHPEVANTVPFRWMGAQDSATVEVGIDRSVDLLVELHVMYVIEERFIDDVRFAIDGVGVDARVRREPDLRFELVAPAATEAGSRLTLSILAPFARKPGPDDPRRLSLAPVRLVARPVDGVDGGPPVWVGLIAAVAGYVRDLEDMAPIRKGTAG